MGFDGDHEALWQAVLGELQLQMAAETFDQWLRGSMAATPDADGGMVVRVRSGRGVGWLDRRLRPQIERTIARIAGHPLGVRFVYEMVPTSEPPDEIPPEEPPARRRFVLPDFDVHDAGWFPISGYENRFWAPLLGRVAWRVWEIVRQADKRKKKSAWTPARRWTAPALAEMVPCGRQAILGVRRCVADGVAGAEQDAEGNWWHRQPGAFDRLEYLGIAGVVQQGERRHACYWIRVRVKLGLLLPELVAELPGRLQVQHDRWLEDHGFEPEHWQ